ncbi:MAG: pilus assembly protein CpaC [Alphaproteobacteria bacterium]|jgi:pilus assembly protein CpaC
MAGADAGKGIIIKKTQSKRNNTGVKLGTGVKPRQVLKPNELRLIQGNTVETKYIDLPVNKAAILRLPRPSRDVVVANPDLMDVVVRSPQELYLFAKEPGHTNAFIFDVAGKQIVNLEINIGIDVKDLERVFKIQIPDSEIKITNMGDTIILSGNVKNAAYAKMARDIAQRLVDSPEKVINNIGVTGQEQVMIKVKVAEIQRTILKQLGIDWNTAFQIGQVAGGFGLVNGFGVNGTPATGIVGSAFNTSNIVAGGIGGLPSFANSGAVQTYLGALQATIAEAAANITQGKARIIALQDAGVANGGTGVTGAQQALINNIQQEIGIASSASSKAGAEILQINNQLTNATSIQDGSPALSSRSAGFQSENLAIDGLLKALERHSLLKTLAEPNLTALSGESAKFLAGGELPYLISQTFGQASVDFKPYGIGLAFTPIVLNEDRISLKISTEISEISETVTAGNSSYPGLSVRRAETTVEMPSGGTMAMAGLIRDDTRRSIDSTPGLKEVPVLGPLFRSNDFKSSQSELVVLVTPYLAKPAHESEFSLPTDGYANPSDMDMYLRGHLSAIYDTQKETADIGTRVTNLLSGESEPSVPQNTDEYIVE